MPRSRTNIQATPIKKGAASPKRTSTANIRKDIASELARLLKHYTQMELAQQVSLHQPQVSLLWNRKAVFADESRYGVVLEGLRQLLPPLGDDETVAELEQLDDQEIKEELDAPSYTKWLTERTAELGIEASVLSSKSKVALPVLNRILSGRTSNPQQATRAKLDKALEKIEKIQSKVGSKGKGIKSAPDTDRLYVGFLFKEDEVNQVPTGAVGVYAIHDRRGFPLYIGSGNLKGRLRQHLKEADFRPSKNASKFSYYIIQEIGADGRKLDGKQLGKQAREIERVLIRFSGNAVSHNTHHRTDLSDW